jgi:Mg-chelatase subunit ChlD
MTRNPDIIVNATLVSPIPVPIDRPELSRGRSSRVNLPTGTSYKLSDNEILALQEQGFTRGLAKSLTINSAAFPLRIWVVDNSGSMSTTDGHRIVETANRKDLKLVDCTRWSEIQQTVEYHARMAHLLKSPTVFRLLNDPGRVVGPQQFSIGENGAESIDDDLALALQTISDASPRGVTPLTEHVREIRANISSMSESLQQEGTRVAIILVTDGLPTDSQGRCDANTKSDFVESLRSLLTLPVWIVIRLCTDEKDAVEFYNNLDKQLEADIEVLDDFTQEAKEVSTKNDWLNYALPIHRCREMGYHSRLLDLLDEKPLSPGELREFLFLLFGAEYFDGVPDPQADWKGFIKHISNLVDKENKQWNPLTKKMAPWINLKKLDKAYNKKGCTIM